MLNIQELCGDSEILHVGNARMSVSGDRAYVWTDTMAHELCVGQTYEYTALSNAQLASALNLNFAGQVESESVFMSSSATARIESPEHSITHVEDEDMLKVAALSCAKWLDHVQTVADLAVSESARKVWYTFLGPKVDLDNVNDEYDITLAKGDKFTIAHVIGQNYAMSFQGSKIKGTLKGHAEALQLIGRATVDKPLGAVSDNKKASFAVAGQIKKNLRTPMAMRKGAVIYTYRNKYYLEDMLTVPLDKILSKQVLDGILKELKPAPDAKIYVKGIKAKQPKVDLAKPTKQPKEHKELLPRGSKRVAAKSIRPLYAAMFPVSAYQQGRSRIVFASTEEEVQAEAIALIRKMDKPVPFSTVATDTADNLYSGTKGSVVIANTATLKLKYPGRRVYKSALAVAALPPDAPNVGAPPPGFPVHKENAVKFYKHVVRLISEGFFITGVELKPDFNTTKGFEFKAPIITNEIHDRIRGAARRLSMYMTNSGIEFGIKSGKTIKKGINIRRGKTTCFLHIPFPDLGDQAYDSATKLVDNPPTLNAPIYTTRDIKRPTVAIDSFNIHTGLCTVRMQRSGNLYAAPFETYYTNLVRKI